jgi:hypothetical protein
MSTTEGMPATAGMGCQQQQKTPMLDTATLETGTSMAAKTPPTAGSEAVADSTGTSRAATSARTLAKKRDVRSNRRGTCNSSVASNFTNQQESKAVFLEKKKK